MGEAGGSGRAPAASVTFRRKVYPMKGRLSPSKSRRTEPLRRRELKIGAPSSSSWEEKLEVSSGERMTGRKGGVPESDVGRRRTILESVVHDHRLMGKSAASNSRDTNNKHKNQSNIKMRTVIDHVPINPLKERVFSNFLDPISTQSLLLRA